MVVVKICGEQKRLGVVTLISVTPAVLRGGGGDRRISGTFWPAVTDPVSRD